MAIIANNNRINELPNDLFDSQIIPLLLDVEDPQSIATLNLVCRQWNQAMQQDRPYASKMKEPNFFQKYPRMKLCEFNSRTMREAFLSYFPKTLREKMELAYAQCQTNTTDFEAKVIVTLIACCPFLGLRLAAKLAKSALTPLAPIILSNMPADLDLRRAQPNPTMRMIAKYSYCLAAITYGLMFACETVLPEDSFSSLQPVFFNLMKLTGVSLLTSLGFVNRFEGDSLLSKTYRAGKASLAASIPLVKTGCSKIKKSATWLINRFRQ